MIAQFDIAEQKHAHKRTVLACTDMHLLVFLVTIDGAGAAQFRFAPVKLRDANAAAIMPSWCSCSSSSRQTGQLIQFACVARPSHCFPGRAKEGVLRKIACVCVCGSARMSAACCRSERVILSFSLARPKD